MTSSFKKADSLMNGGYSPLKQTAAPNNNGITFE